MLAYMMMLLIQVQPIDENHMKLTLKLLAKRIDRRRRQLDLDLTKTE